MIILAAALTLGINLEIDLGALVHAVENPPAQGVRVLDPRRLLDWSCR